MAGQRLTRTRSLTLAGQRLSNSIFKKSCRVLPTKSHTIQLRWGTELASRVAAALEAQCFPDAGMIGSLASPAVTAELQILLAEVKRLSMHQEQLRHDVTSLDTWEGKAAASRTNKSADLKLNGCKIAPCPGPALTVPLGRQWTPGSSDWSEAAAETPVRNVISGAPHTDLRSLPSYRRLSHSGIQAVSRIRRRLLCVH